MVERDVRARVLARPELVMLHPFMRVVAWDTVLCVPLSFEGRTLGVLTTYFRPERIPLESDTAFLWAAADQGAIAVERERLFRRAQESAALLERQKLARELHDSVSQALYGIALGAQTAQGVLDDGPEAARGPLAYVISLAKAGMAEMRALIFELRPESLEQEGLVVALSKQAEALRARYRLTVDLELCPEPGASLPVKEALYRIGQEALHNIVKHARAERVCVHLEQVDAELRLTVTDDGVGFDVGASFPGHLGLVSMRERVERLGGSISLASAPGRGATVRALVPLAAAPAPPHLPEANTIVQ